MSNKKLQVLVRPATHSWHKAAYLALATGVIAGTGASVADPLVKFLPPKARTNVVAHAETRQRKAVSAGFTKTGTVYDHSAWWQYASPGWGFSLHKTGANNWVYCVNVGLIGAAASSGSKVPVAPDGKTIVDDASKGFTSDQLANTGGSGGISPEALRSSGILKIIDMAGENGYQGLIKYKDSIFNGIGPNTTITLHNAYGGTGQATLHEPGSFYAMITQVAIHAHELPAFYAGNTSGLGQYSKFRSLYHSYLNGNTSGASLSVTDNDTGRHYNFNSAQIAQMANKVAVEANKRQQISLADRLAQKYVLDVQGANRPYDRSESNRDDWGSYAETVSGVSDEKNDPQNIDTNAELRGMPTKRYHISAKTMKSKNITFDSRIHTVYNSDGSVDADQPLYPVSEAKYHANVKTDNETGMNNLGRRYLGTEPIAITGSNLDAKGRKDHMVTLSINGTGAGKDYSVYNQSTKEHVQIKSRAVPLNHVIGYQISKSANAKTSSDDATKIDENNIEWGQSKPDGTGYGPIHKFGEPIDFKELNGHYIRLVVDNGSNGVKSSDPKTGEVKWNDPDWNGVSYVDAQINFSIPQEKFTYPIAVVYKVAGPIQKFTGSDATEFQLASLSMNAKMRFYVRQDQVSPEPGGTQNIKTMAPVTSDFIKVSKTFNDKGFVSGKTNPNQLDTFSDGKQTVQPKDFKNLTPEQNDAVKTQLAQKPILNATKLDKNGKGGIVPGKEYAYTIHLNPGPDIRKQGSDQLDTLSAQDVKLPKWFVYKTAMVTSGPDRQHQQVYSELTNQSKIQYKPTAGGGGTVNFRVSGITKNAKLSDAVLPAVTHDSGDVELTIFGTADPNVVAKAAFNNETLEGIDFNTQKITVHGGTPPTPSDLIKQDIVKGVTTKDPQGIMNDVIKVNKRVGKTVGVVQSGNHQGYLSMQSDNIKTAHIRQLNTNVTADETGAYGSHSNEIIEPAQYDKILTKKMTIKDSKQQKQLYYVMIANSGNDYGKDKDGFKQIHFSDYLDPNLSLDTKNRPMMVYDLSEMNTRKAGANNAVMTPFAQQGQFAAANKPGVESYMSNIVYASSNQLNANGKRIFGVTPTTTSALASGMQTYVSPADHQSWLDGVGKVGNKNYSEYYRAGAGKGYKDYTKLGKMEDTYGSYDANRKLDGTNEVGWYAYSHGSVDGGKTTALRDLDGRQRVSWTVRGEDAKALSNHTMMFMIPVKVKDNATYVTDNNQTPEIDNDAEYTTDGHGNPPDENPDTPGQNDGITTSTTHGNGYHYSDTVKIYPIRKDTLLTKKEQVTKGATESVGKPSQGDKIVTGKQTHQPGTYTSDNIRRNLDDSFTYRMDIRMPNWADKNNLDDMHGKDAKFQVYDNLALPFDLKNVTVYDETAHKTLVPSLKAGLQSGNLALEKQAKWDSTKATQHPRLVYRPYGDVTSNHPQDVFKLANHKLVMKAKVVAPFEQGETNQRLGKLSNAKTDAIYDKYMEKHEEQTNVFSVPNEFHVTHQSTTDDGNDGPHQSDTIKTSYGSKVELNLDGMRVDTNKVNQGDSFKMFFSTKIPFGHLNKDLDGKVNVKVIADKEDNSKLDHTITLYDRNVPLSRLTNVRDDGMRTFKNQAQTITKYQQGSMGVGKYTLNGTLDTSQLSDSLKHYYSGIDLRDKAGYLKPDAVDQNGGVKREDGIKTYDQHRRPLYVRVKVTADEQTLNRDLAINGDRSFRGSNGKFIDPFHSGMVARADFAYGAGVDPRFASIAPETSYSYFGQNRTGAKVDGAWAQKHHGVTMIQTLFDSTQLHRFDKQGDPTVNKGNVDQTIGAGAGDGIRNDVRMQRFGWGNLQSKPGSSNVNSATSPKKMLQDDQMQMAFDSQLENGSAIKYKTADQDTVVKNAKKRYLDSTGANVAANWQAGNSFWTAGSDGNVNLHTMRAKVNGYGFVNNDKSDYKKDMLHAQVDSEHVDAPSQSDQARFAKVPRAIEHDSALQATTSAWGSPVGKYLTNLQTAHYAVDGKGGVKDANWTKDSQGYLADNTAKDLVIDNQSGLTTIGNAPNSKQNDKAVSQYTDKKANGVLATDGGSFFATNVQNNYKNYKFYNRSLRRGTGQVGMMNAKEDSDVLSSKFTNNARARKINGTVNGREKFYLPMWFTNNNEHDTFSSGTGEAQINPLIYFSDGDADRINADYSDVNFTRWLRIFGHRYGFNGSNSSDYDSMLISGHLAGSKSKALNKHENAAVNNAQRFDRKGTPAGMTD